MVEERPVQNPSTPNDKGEIVAINILGNEIRLRTQASSAYIQKLAQDVENRIKRCMSETGIVSSLKAVILVCLDLTDELEKEKKQRSVAEALEHKRHLRGDKVWEERIDKLLDEIPLV
jgi:cell division protein ZapA (FtsZ GTPase activity inhibitor)